MPYPQPRGPAASAGWRRTGRLASNGRESVSSRFSLAASCCLRRSLNHRLPAAKPGRLEHSGPRVSLAQQLDSRGQVAPCRPAVCTAARSSQTRAHRSDSDARAPSVSLGPARQAAGAPAASSWPHTACGKPHRAQGCLATRTSRWPARCLHRLADLSRCCPACNERPASAHPRCRAVQSGRPTSGAASWPTCPAPCSCAPPQVSLAQQAGSMTGGSALRRSSCCDQARPRRNLGL